MSDFEFEQPGSVEPAELATPEPFPVEAGPITPPPSEVTRFFAAEAAALRDGTTPPSALPEPQLPEQPAPLEQQPPAGAPFPDQAAFEEWLEATVEHAAEARALEYVQEEVGDLVELGLLDDEELGQIIQQMPEEVQAALQRRSEQIEEALLLQDIGLADRRVDEANALMAEGSARLDELVAGWQAETPGGPEVDPSAVFEKVVERWPDVALRIGESPELAEGMLRQAWEELATEAIGETKAFGLIEDELRKVGAEADPATVLRIKQLADEIWPQIQRRNPDQQAAVLETIQAAASLATGGREPQSAKQVTRYYAAKARQIRAANGQVDGMPSLRASGGSLPSLVTAKFAAEAAAIRARSGLP